MINVILTLCNNFPQGVDIQIEILDQDGAGYQLVDRYNYSYRTPASYPLEPLRLIGERPGVFTTE